MSNLILVIVCLSLGLLFQRLKVFSDNSAMVLNNYVIYVAFPALVLNAIPQLPIELNSLLPVLSAWIIMGFSFILIFFVTRFFRWSHPINGAVILLVTLGNTSFIGIPLIEAHLGTDAIPFAILYDQLGTFLALNTFGIITASIFSESQVEYSVPIWKKIVLFPPFISLVLAGVLYPIDYPAWMTEVLSRIASTLVPVVMVAVGLQWKLKLEQRHRLPLLVAIVFVLVLEPAFALILVKIIGVSGLAASTIVLQAAMPAMISAGVLATAYNLEPKLSASIVGYSLLLSLFSTWAWSEFVLY